jgi:chromate transporter
MDKPAQPKPTLAELFIAFATISLSGFGGVLAWARRMMVERRRWLTAEQFNDAYAVCVMLPGANIVNFSIVFGSRVRGPLGGVTALGGLLGPPIVLVIVFAALYARFGDIAVVRHALTGVAAAAAGLIASTVAKMALPLFQRRAFTGPLMAAATFIAIGIMQWSLPLVLVVLAPISLALAVGQRFWRPP